MKNIYKCFGLLFILSGLVACEIDEIEPNLLPEPAALPALQAGSLDFSKYVAVGASFTAGFTDGALFLAGQENSFPNILAQQFSNANGGSFTQPLTNDNVGGLLLGGNVIQGTRLFFNGAGPASLPGTPTNEVTNQLSGSFNNMGVPGAKSFHILAPGYGSVAGVPAGTANPFFARFSSSATASVLDDALAQNPTFFTLSEIGGNDVLGYATSGGDGSNPITPSAGPVGVGFDATFATLVGAMTSGGAKGLVTNVPFITDLPHFTTVPHNPLDPTNETFGPLIPTLNNVYGALNGVYAFLESQGAITDAAARTITFSTTDASAVVMRDENLPDLSAQIAGVLSASPQFAGLLTSFGLPTDPVTVGTVAALFGATYGQARQATAEELLVLPSSSVIGTVNTDAAAFLVSQGLSEAIAGQFSVEGVTLPLADKWVLTPQEQMAIENATNAYNATIQAVASANDNVVLVDLNSVLAQASTTGVSFDNYVMTTDLVFGGLVSLDGIHLTSRGYGLMANKFLEAADAGFGSNFAASGSMAKADDLPIFYPPSLQ